MVEVIESEQTDYNCMAIKQSLCQRWGLSIALDDFGAGYSSEGVLLTINPSYVKIDMSIVRGIDRDKSRQTLLGGILSYSKTQDIRIIAEGVETREEMVYLIEAGVDYIQGYYLAVPDFRVRGIPQERKQEIQEAAGRAATSPHRLVRIRAVVPRRAAGPSNPYNVKRPSLGKSFPREGLVFPYSAGVL